jgi:hypothetical protein
MLNSLATGQRKSQQKFAGVENEDLACWSAGAKTSSCEQAALW